MNTFLVIDVQSILRTLNQLNNMFIDTRLAVLLTLGIQHVQDI